MIDAVRDNDAPPVALERPGLVGVRLEGQNDARPDEQGEERRGDPVVDERPPPGAR